MVDIDQIALKAAREIVGETPTGLTLASATQYQARIQCIVADALRRHAQRAPTPWDVYWDRHHEPVEKLAAEIYATFVYDGPGTKPDWTPHGNGTKQDDARSLARDELRAAGHAPTVAVAANLPPVESVCSLCLGTGKVFHENPPRKDTPWSRCRCGGTLAVPHPNGKTDGG